jgi:biopolymer transport protein ExbD
MICLDREHRWYLNASPTTIHDLPGALRDGLSRRAVWMVYVEGDPDLPCGEVVAAIDIARSCHASAAHLTENRKDTRIP